MQTYEIIVSGRSVHANSADTSLVRTSIGIDKIHVLFDNAEWTQFPVRVTFANGDVLVSTSVTLTAIDAPEWAAEAECVIPWEVIQTLGGIRVTFQGTDASGNHIITEASGTPLIVVEAGDVGDGTVPQPAPTVDEWNQAYANAMAAASDAESAAEQISEILHGTDAQTLEELIAALGSALRYKGSVSTYADLPDDAEQGDTYNVAAAYGDYPAGTNWAWTGQAWDALGGEIDLSQFATKDVATQSADGLMASTDKAKLDGIETGANAYELPLMSTAMRGGAMLGDGLSVDDGKLSLGPLVQSGSGESVETPGCALHSVDAQGWAEQESTTGKNLYHETGRAIGQTWDSSVGITFTKIDESTYLATGTATGNAWPYAGGSSNVSDDFFKLIPAGTYTAHVNTSKLAVLKRVDGSRQVVYSGDNSSYTFTLEDDSYIVVVPIIANGDTVSNFECKVQLEAGSTATSYEPYTGGKPSPSPEYPQEIRVARGRNLLEVSEYATNQSGATTKVMTVPPLKAGDVVCISGSTTDGTVLSPANCDVVWIKNGSQVKNVGVDGNPITVTSDMATADSFNVFSRSAIAGKTIRVQLELGSTPTPYVPYGHVGLEVQGRNLLSKKALVNTYPYTQNGITWKMNNDGSITVSGTASGNSVFDANYARGFLSDSVDLTGAYTASVHSDNDVSKLQIAMFYRSPNTTSGISPIKTGTDEITANINDLVDGNIISVGFYIVSGNSINATFYPQLEYGDTAHDYEPYHHETRAIPLPLKSDGERWAAGLPDGMADHVSVDSAGRWEWESVSGEAVFDGDETWSQLQADKQYAAVPNARNGTARNCLCTHGVYNSVTGSVGQFSVSGGNLIVNSGLESVDEFKPLIASKPLTLMYTLATPTIESGYISLPALPEGATVSCPELERAGIEVSWFVPGAAELVEHAENWHKREDLESRVEALEAAIAEIATA